MGLGHLALLSYGLLAKSVCDRFHFITILQKQKKFYKDFMQVIALEPRSKVAIDSGTPISMSLSIGEALARMQLHPLALDRCVKETFERFSHHAPEAAAELDESSCPLWVVQSMFAAMVAYAGALEESVVEGGVAIRGARLESLLDRVVHNEFVRCGFFSVDDEISVWSYKLLVFVESWDFCVRHIGCSAALRGSVQRVCDEWGQRLQGSGESIVGFRVAA